MLVTEQHCNSTVAEGLALRLIRDICEANGDSAKGRGCPNPYYSAEDALRIAHRYDQSNDEQFVGFSDSVLALVHFLARRLRRQALTSLWYGVTRLGLADYIPGNAADGFARSRRMAFLTATWWMSRKVGRDCKRAPETLLPIHCHGRSQRSQLFFFGLYWCTPTALHRPLPKLSTMR